MSELTEAAERLRSPQWDRTSKCFDVKMNARIEWVDDLCCVADSYLAETDPTPIDEQYAKSVSESLSVDGTWRWYHLGNLSSILVRGESITFWRSGTKLLDDPTRGQLRTAARLFGIPLKEPQ